MTRSNEHPELRSVSLRLHAGARSVTWAVVYRTTRGDAVFDRRVSSGQLDAPRSMVGPITVVEALEAALREIRLRYGLPPAAGGSGAPGGGGGDNPRAQTAGLETAPLSVVRDAP